VSKKYGAFRNAEPPNIMRISGFVLANGYLATELVHPLWLALQPPILPRIDECPVFRTLHAAVDFGRFPLTIQAALCPTRNSGLIRQTKRPASCH